MSKQKKAFMEPLNLDPSYTVLRMFEHLQKNYTKEMNHGFFRAMLQPVYDMFGAKFIAETLLEKPYLATLGENKNWTGNDSLDHWKTYFKELEAHELSIQRMMEAEDTCELFKK